MIHNIPQPVFEEFVARNLLHDSNNEIRKGVSYISSKEVGFSSRISRPD